MTQIDFYVLPDASSRSRTLFVCRLAGKAFGLGQRSFVHLASETEARELDDLMWTFRDRSFLPHGLVQPGNAAPVVLGYGQEPDDHCPLLINLAPEVPAFFSRFERVVEVVDANPQIRAQGREHFRFYKDRGYPLQTHTL